MAFKIISNDHDRSVRSLIIRGEGGRHYEITYGNSMVSVRFQHGTDPYEINGITNEDMLRVLIDRVETLQVKCACDENITILKALRTALVAQNTRMQNKSPCMGLTGNTYLPIDTPNSGKSRLETLMNLPDGYYYLVHPQEPEPSLAYLYTHPQTTLRVFAFSPHEGGGTLPVTDLSNDTVVQKVEIKSGVETY